MILFPREEDSTAHIKEELMLSEWPSGRVLIYMNLYLPPEVSNDYGLWKITYHFSKHTLKVQKKILQRFKLEKNFKFRILRAENKVPSMSTWMLHLCYLKLPKHSLNFQSHGLKTWTVQSFCKSPRLPLDNSGNLTFIHIVIYSYWGGLAKSKPNFDNCLSVLLPCILLAKEQHYWS